MDSKVELGMLISSRLVFLRSKTNGKMRRVVKNNLQNAIVSGGASQNNQNIAANETTTTETERATYGFLIKDR